ncbi:MAG: hypothetical protein AAGI49_01915 [Bacteroidota bacterium]
MNKQKTVDTSTVIGIVVLTIAILQGIGLRLFIPAMSGGMDNFTLILLSGCTALMFMPYTLQLVVRKLDWQFFVISLFIGAISGMISGYFWDCLLSNMLVGAMSLISYWLIKRFSLSPTSEMMANFMLLAAISLGVNILGHQIVGKDAAFYLSLVLFTVKNYLVVGGICVWINSKLMPSINTNRKDETQSENRFQNSSVDQH